MDAVAARDHEQEVAAACAICATHLSRMAEELVLWSSGRNGTSSASGRTSPPARRSCPRSAIPTVPSWSVARPPASSAMPSPLLVLPKNLPLAYNRDLPRRPRAPLPRCPHHPRLRQGHGRHVADPRASRRPLRRGPSRRSQPRDRARRSPGVEGRPVPRSPRSRRTPGALLRRRGPPPQRADRGGSVSLPIPSWAESTSVLGSTLAPRRNVAPPSGARRGPRSRVKWGCCGKAEAKPAPVPRRPLGGDGRASRSVAGLRWRS